jgi:hypothetical protein
MASNSARPRWTGKPLQIAVDDVPGTTEVAQHPGTSSAALAARPSRRGVIGPARWSIARRTVAPSKTNTPG